MPAAPSAVARARVAAVGPAKLEAPSRHRRRRAAEARGRRSSAQSARTSAAIPSTSGRVARLRHDGSWRPFALEHDLLAVEGRRRRAWPIVDTAFTATRK